VLLSGYSENELIGKKLAKLLKISDPNMMSIHHKKRLNGISDTYEVSVTIKKWICKNIGSLAEHRDIMKKGK